MANVLLVHPRFPVTYWGFQDALRLVDKRASLPPLGLVTLAACLPEQWRLRLVDLNVQELREEDLRWCDVVFLGGMMVQLDSMREVTARAQALGRPVVVGGPTATTDPDLFPRVDLVFQGEAEGRIPELVRAVEATLTDSHPPVIERRVIPAGDDKPDLSLAPVPRFDLLKIDRYTSMAIQYSRGCPFHCEFCDVIEIFGRVSRVKSADQIIAELDALHGLGFDGSVFLVDDNFIGNKREVNQLLPRMEAWQKSHGRPYEFYTEASINLAADPALMAAMVAAGFSTVFVGIETPSKSALKEAGKGQNLRLELDEAVDTMTRAGLEVMGGFIVGFDTDDADIFDAQRELIQSSPIALAMVGLLIALPGTKLWRRLEKEGRLRGRTSGDQFGRSNIIPIMDEEALLRGYRDLLRDLYTADAFYRRCEAHVSRVGDIPAGGSRGLGDLSYFLKAALRIGIQSPRRWHFWGLLRSALGAPRHTIKYAVVKALQGEHMIRYTEEHVLPRLDQAIAGLVLERQTAEAAGLTKPAATPRQIPHVAHAARA
ncbi:MAG: radical SAM protein [bacterium]